MVQDIDEIITEGFLLRNGFEKSGPNRWVYYRDSFLIEMEDEGHYMSCYINSPSALISFQPCLISELIKALEIAGEQTLINNLVD